MYQETVYNTRGKADRSEKKDLFSLLILFGGLVLLELLLVAFRGTLLWLSVAAQAIVIIGFILLCFYVYSRRIVDVRYSFEPGFELPHDDAEAETDDERETERICDEDIGCFIAQRMVGDVGTIIAAAYKGELRGIYPPEAEIVPIAGAKRIKTISATAHVNTPAHTLVYLQNNVEHRLRIHPSETLTDLINRYLTEANGD